MDVKKSIIACIGRNRELGKNNSLLWHIPEDLAYFKKVTAGCPVIMGRSTFLSLPEKFRPLPGRKNIVLSRSGEGLEEYQEEIITVNNLEKAFRRGGSIARKSDRKEIFVIGGASVYEQSLRLVDRLYLTIVDEVDETADVYFPKYDDIFKKEISLVSQDNGRYKFDFVILEKV